MVAANSMAVLVLLRVLATTLPPLGVKVRLFSVVGAAVSSVKVLVTALLGLPWLSVATAVTVMVPSCNLLLAPVPRSPASSLMVWLLPVPVTVLVTVLLPFAKVKTTLAPASAVKLKMPLLLVASAAVTPSAMPVTGVRLVRVGGSKSNKVLTLLLTAVWVLPLTVAWSVTSTL